MSESNLSTATNLAAELCRHFEGFSAKPYLCPAGYWTQGYGTVNKPDGSTVKPTDLPVSRATAEAWLVGELRGVYILGVLQLSPQLIHYPEALAALGDFAYNLGVPRYRASTLRRRVDAGDWPAAKLELAKWTRGGGRVLPGLVRRRAAEIALLPTA